ncbi:uncharacterized protein LOC143597974 [Bidens hawaiensis]|uniref:uncharacterized protein LOC143597974 n=1 Tax=Bidens hawaiensis TaxID=980011 RepID=UPI0040499C89
MIRAHAVESRRQIRIVKDDLVRVRAMCKGDRMDGSQSKGGGKKKGESSKCNQDKGPNEKHVGGRGIKKDPDIHKCPWVVQLSKNNKHGSWEIVTLQTEHKCLQTRDIYACTATFLSNQLLEQLQETPKIQPRAIKEQFQRMFEVNISEMKAYRAKNIVVEKIHGDYTSQYHMLRDYVEELKHKNPGTTVTIEVQPCTDPTSNTRIFKRIYVCLGSLKQGFKEIGRNLLGLDGAFIKGPHPGQLLTAVGLDPNNCIYPVSYAIVEAENNDSWTWFLQCLADDMDLDSNSYFTFISDRQKGLLPAVERLFPFAEHRFCARHIQENMKQQFKGKIYKDAFYKMARCTTPVQFEKEMHALKKINIDAQIWLSNIRPEHWSLSHFTGRALSDVLLNNMCEVFNAKLLEARDKPIITMLEYIREYLMRRIVNVMKVIDKCEGMLTPYATTIFETVKKDASSWNGEEHYQVSGPHGDQCVVNMRDKSCTCRIWEVTGIPCKHAVASIWVKRKHDRSVGIPETFVNEIYGMERWKAVYKHKVYPLNGISLWEKSQVPTIIAPPKYHKPIGRPKKSRKRSAVEIEEGGASKKKKNGQYGCSKCGKKGHNVRSCTAKIVTKKSTKKPTKKATKKTTKKTTKKATKNIK